MSVNVQDKKEEIIEDHKKKIYAYDLVKVPMGPNENFFILHATDGLKLIDPINRRTFKLRQDQNKSFGVCKSVATSLIDEQNPGKGFWLANIDISDPSQPCVKCYAFNNQDTQLMLGKSDSMALRAK